MDPVRLIAEVLVLALGIYLAVGLGVAIWMLTTGLKILDGKAAAGGLGFKLLILLGMAALWPLLMEKVRMAKRDLPATGEQEAPYSQRWLREKHAGTIGMLILIVPVIVGLGLFFRPGAIRVQAGPQTLLSPDPLGQPITEPALLFADYPITAFLRLEDQRNLFQIELDIAEDLVSPPVLLFVHRDGDPNNSKSSVFLGNLWGPDPARRFMLPPASDGTYVFSLYSLSERTVLATGEIPIFQTSVSEGRG